MNNDGGAGGKKHATATYFSNIFMECGQELETFFFTSALARAAEWERRRGSNKIHRFF